jgi:branched-chain amino acid transport system permease protein
VAVISTTYSRLRQRFSHGSRAFGDFATGAGLWLLIVVFCSWAFIGERDAFVVGLVSGSVFALGAIGITLIYGVLKFGHFAHGDSMMFAAYVAFLLLTGTMLGDNSDVTALPVSLGDLPGANHHIWNFSFGYGLLVAMVLTAVLMAGLFILLDRLVYRPLRRRHSGIVIYSIASLGLALVFRSLIFIFWGQGGRFYSKGLRDSVELPLGIRVLNDQLFVLAMALTMAALLYLLLFRTKLGKAMRAMADNPELARVAGINTDQIVVWTWAVSGSLVAAAGVMLALQAQLDPQLGFVILLPLFAATILGGIGSPQGALIGGLVIGIVQEVAVSVQLNFIQEGFPAPGYKFSIAFVVIITILLIRPRGLFGKT